MTSRERFQSIMNGEPFDRLPLLEWASWWDRTLRRWYKEGLPETLTDRYEICRHFGLDLYRQEWFNPRGPGCPRTASQGAGIINSMKEYEKIREHLFPSPVVDPRRWTRWAEYQKGGEAVLWFTVDGFFWFPRTLLGIENHFYALYDQPELIRRMNDDLTKWIIRVIEEISAFCIPDFMSFGEDLCSSRGPMVSEACFEKFLKPCYQVVIPFLRERGIFTFVDSDGDMTIPASWFEEAGLDGMLPLERRAGMDADLLRSSHPRMRCIGNFNKLAMNRGEAAIRAEFERLLPTAAKGGFLISCDHQTPPGVSYGDYRRYLSLFREYAEKAGRLSQNNLPREN